MEIIKDVLSLVCALLAFGCAVVAIKRGERIDELEKENSRLTFKVLTGEDFDE